MHAQQRNHRRFFDLFRKEHTALEASIRGVPGAEDCAWYASVLLNRLMFCSFLQQRGFLAGDRRYLKNRLRNAGSEGYFRGFLLPFFHRGIGRAERSAPDGRFSAIPALAGTCFAPHALEKSHPIEIADDAFARIFDFLDSFEWVSRRQTNGAENRIDADVLGHVLEQYVNQKQMGAYYTGEDVTGYIAESTILPLLLGRAAAASASAAERFRTLVRSAPGRYIRPEVRHGADAVLPPEISRRVIRPSQSDPWNSFADDRYGLPGELWRETVARREHVRATREHLASNPPAVEDCITLNLDLSALLTDLVAGLDGRALSDFYAGLRQLRVLDPTCGSGAFLFAALDVLEPIHHRCIARMREVPSGNGAGDGLRETLREIDDSDLHPNPRFFIRKEILRDSLFGVDIMGEAAEICKMRLLLSLVEEIDDAGHFETLPDLDGNIRTGNALTGFATRRQAERYMGSRLDFADEAESFPLHQRQSAAAGPDGFPAFGNGEPPAGDSTSDTREQSHRPFHWWIEFPDAIRKGGFDVIVGNPPYVEYSRVRREYRVSGFDTERCGNIYAFTCERSWQLLRPDGRLGLIVPLSIMTTARMAPLQRLMLQTGRTTWLSTFDVYPTRLFEGAKQRLAILLSGPETTSPGLFTTTYNRWRPPERPHLLANLRYQPSKRFDALSVIPKLGHPLEARILKKLHAHRPAPFVDPAGAPDFYVHRIPYNFVKAVDFVPYFRNERDGRKKSEDYKPFRLADRAAAPAVLAMLNSSLFFWWWYKMFEGYHCGRHEITAFPCGLEAMSDPVRIRLRELAALLMANYRKNARRKEATYRATGRVVYEEFYPRLSIHLLNEIDAVLAEHYGLTEEELDFILHYDLKYRLGDQLPGLSERR